MDAGTGLGAASLGIEVCKGLWEYYQAWESYGRDMTEVRESLHQLERLFAQVHTTFSNINSAETAESRQFVQEALKQCEVHLQKVRTAVGKLGKENTPADFGEKLKAAGKRLTYPFHKETIEKLKRLAKDRLDFLGIAIHMFQLDLDISKTQAIDSIQQDTTELRKQSAAILEGTARIEATTAATAQEVKTAAEKQRLDDIAKWLDAPDTSTDHAKARSEHLPGTGVWFLQSDKYKDWLSDDGKPGLWVTGKAGCCKTVLCSTIIEDLKSKYTSPDTAVAYFYFTFIDHGKQTCPDMLTALLHQLCLQSPIAQELQTVFDNRQRDVKALLSVLRSFVTQKRKTFIVLDALDESPLQKDVRDKVLDSLEELMREAPNKVKILMTSRYESHIETAMRDERVVRFAIGDTEVNEDILSYTNHHLKTHRSLQQLTKDQKDQIMESFRANAGGMFKWAQCQLDEIKNAPILTKGNLAKLLTSLPGDLPQTYERILNDLPTHTRHHARIALYWLTFAARPLTPEELVEACITQTEKPYVDEESRDILKQITKLLSPLIKIVAGYERFYGVIADSLATPDVVTVHLAHFSVKEFLLSREASDWFFLDERLSMTYMAQACAAYILHAFPHRSHSAVAHRAQYPLIAYAVALWAPCQAVTESTGRKVQATDLHLEILNNDDLRGYADLRCSHYMMDRDLISVESDSPSALFFAIDFALDQTCAYLLTNGADATKEERGQLPLHRAVVAKIPNTIDILLKHGADPQAIDSNSGESCLTWACEEKRNPKVLRALFKNCNLNAVNQYGRTPLLTAIDAMKEDFVKILLELGADPNCPGEEGVLPLKWACAGMDDYVNPDIVIALIERGADVQVHDEGGRTALHHAAGSGDYDAGRAVTALIKAGAAVDLPDGDGWTPLHQACNASGYDSIEALLDANADVNNPIVGDSNMTPLALACAAKEPILEIVELLLDRGATVPRGFVVREADCWCKVGLKTIFSRFKVSVCRQVASLLVARGAKDLWYEVDRDKVESCSLQLSDGEGKPIYKEQEEGWVQALEERIGPDIDMMFTEEEKEQSAAEFNRIVEEVSKMKKFILRPNFNDDTWPWM